MGGGFDRLQVRRLNFLNRYGKAMLAGYAAHDRKFRISFKPTAWFFPGGNSVPA